MSKLNALLTETAAVSISTGVVVESGRAVVVAPDDDPPARIRCRVLETSENGVLAPRRGDLVLVWRATPVSDTGVVLGRIGPSVHPAPPKETPDTLVLEAKKGLVLRVGEGSIEIRADGKILIKGKDLVSHAKRMNRIRGGSVSLN
jgi:hypothetical protein